MTQRSHGLFVGRTRHLARHHLPSRLSISSMVKELKAGDMVAIVPKGNFRDIPHPRYRGRIGIVVGRRGRAYAVRIELTRKTSRMLVVDQRHLEKISD